MTAPSDDSWKEQQRRTPKQRMPRGSLPAAFLTFSLLVLVFAVGFVVGRAVIARAYVKAGPEIDRQKLPQAEGQEEAKSPPAPLVPSAVHVPERYQEPETPPPGAEENGVEVDSEGGAAPAETAAPSEAGAEQPQPQSAGERPGPYVLQVGAFVSEQGARELADELTRAGYPTTIQPDRSGDQVTYRVFTGHFRTEEEARQEAMRLQEDGFDAFLAQR